MISLYTIKYKKTFKNFSGIIYMDENNTEIKTNKLSNYERSRRWKLANREKTLIQLKLNYARRKEKKALMNMLINVN